MADKLQVKEHLRNAALYQPLAESPLSEQWKRRLFRQYCFNRQLNTVLPERTGFFKWLLYFGPPVLCILLVFAAYFGFIQTGEWAKRVVRIANFAVPPIGLKEIFVFAVIINGLTLLVRKPMFPR
jgi:hypothetical protein